MRCGLALLALGGCGFHASVRPDDSTGDGAVDAAIDGNAPGAQPSAFCADTHVIACYEFESDTKDGSTNHLDAASTGVGFPPGQVGKAMQFAATSTADVPDSSRFDVSAVTIEAWIKPSQLPASGKRGYVIDMNNQYALYVSDNGDLHCTMIGGPSVTSQAGISTSRWTHIACSYDGATAAVVYVDGSRRDSSNGSGTLSTGGTTGISLASDNPPGSGNALVGLIDQLRLVNVARTGPEICADAGKSSCPPPSLR